MRLQKNLVTENPGILRRDFFEINFNFSVFSFILLLKTNKYSKGRLKMMLNILLVVMVIAAVALAFYAFRSTGDCFLPCFVCGMVAAVAWGFLVDMPFNFETKTNSYALTQLENQQFYSIGTGNKSISVLINDDGVLKKKSFNEDIVAITTTETEAPKIINDNDALKQKTFDEAITEIVVGETDTPKVEITGEYQKYDYFIYERTDEPEYYTKVVIYVPEEN